LTSALLDSRHLWGRTLGARTIERAPKLYVAERVSTTRPVAQSASLDATHSEELQLEAARAQFATLAAVMESKVTFQAVAFVDLMKH
jgi:hypothetical protein